MWKRIGFMKHAPEFWMLSRVIVERVASCQGRLQATEMVSDAGPWGESQKAYALDNYDVTSMDQLRATILAATNSQ